MLVLQMYNGGMSYRTKLTVPIKQRKIYLTDRTWDILDRMSKEMQASNSEVIRRALIYLESEVATGNYNIELTNIT